MLKMGIITGFLSRTKDRFHDYNAPLELEQKFALMTQIDGYDGSNKTVQSSELRDWTVTLQPRSFQLGFYQKQ